MHTCTHRTAHNQQSRAARRVHAAERRAHLQGGVADVDEGDVERGRLWQVRLEDAPVERDRRGLVHEAQALEAREGGGVEHGEALRLGEVHRHGERAVRDGAALVRLGNVLEVLEEARHDLLRRELARLAEKGHVDEAPAVGALGDLEHKVLDVLLHVWVGELAADEALDLHDGVLDVHGEAGGALDADKAHLVAVGHHRGRLALALSVHDDVHAALARERHARRGIAHLQGCGVSAGVWGGGASDGHGLRTTASGTRHAQAERVYVRRCVRRSARLLVAA